MTNPFGNLQELKLDGTEEIEYTFYQLEGSPTIKCRHAGEPNRAYHKALLEKSTKLAKAMRGRDATPGDLRKSRAYDVELFPLFIVTGWDEDKAPIGADGERVAFDRPAAASFVEALAEFAPDIFDEWRTYVSQTANFRNAPTREDGKDLGES